MNVLCFHRITYYCDLPTICALSLSCMQFYEWINKQKEIPIYFELSPYKQITWLYEYKFIKFEQFEQFEDLSIFSFGKISEDCTVVTQFLCEYGIKNKLCSLSNIPYKWQTLKMKIPPSTYPIINYKKIECPAIIVLQTWYSFMVSIILYQLSYMKHPNFNDIQYALSCNNPYFETKNYDQITQQDIFSDDHPMMKVIKDCKDDIDLRITKSIFN